MYDDNKKQSMNDIKEIQSSLIELYTKEYYFICSIGGLLSCGLTHTFVTPLDLVKCRRQVMTICAISL